ncbi:hypothetical protein [Chroococcidiopsis sp.]|uniref:hypothetical protein n=1 Tax=Chroococcidiopsis sp. TaxID=3088168 RepID=UPI003F3AFD17
MRTENFGEVGGISAATPKTGALDYCTTNTRTELESRRLQHSTPEKSRVVEILGFAM